MNNLICLTGAIGSGKSTVASILEQDGFVQVDISMMLATCYKDVHHHGTMACVQKEKRIPSTGVRNGIIEVGNYLDVYLPSLVTYILSTHKGRDIVIPSVKNIIQFDAIKRLTPEYNHILARVMRPFNSSSETIDSRTEISDTSIQIINNGTLLDLIASVRDAVRGKFSYVYPQQTVYANSSLVIGA